MIDQEEDTIKEPIDIPDNPAAEEDDIFDIAKAMLLAAVFALCIRTFLFEPFNIPSGSMLPSLQVGDYLFVEKYSYGYGKYSFPLGIVDFDGRIFGRMPARGDVAVFRKPQQESVDYIKRIIGLPGDEISVRKGILHINGVRVRREFLGAENYQDDLIFSVYSRYIETLPNGVQHYIFEYSDEERYDETITYTVPAGYYFAMGDNRDSSLDSRAQDQVGFIPAENLIGRAWFLFFSTEGVTRGVCDREGVLAGLRSFGCKLVEWPKAIRYDRIFKSVHSL